MTFKVKDDAPKGSKIEIKIKDEDVAYIKRENESGNIKCAPLIIDIPEEKQEETPKLQSVNISKGPNKTKYKEGEEFSRTGMVVIAKYSDGKSSEVTDYMISPDRELKTSDKEVTITYTEGGITKTTRVEINVEKADKPTPTPTPTPTPKLHLYPLTHQKHHYS